MSFDIQKEISLISNDIKDEENQLTKLNSVYNKIPENIRNNFSEKYMDSQNFLENSKNTLEIIKKIDEINKSDNLKTKLTLLKTLFISQTISNPYLKQCIISKLINKEMIKKIEESFLNINYPMFKGKIVMTIYEELNFENREDLEIITLYFEIYSYIANDLYKEFPNYGNLESLIKKSNEKDEKKHFYFMEMISDFMYKKILATIFYNKSDKNNKDDVLNEKELPGYQKKLSWSEKNIFYKFKKLLYYFSRCISNTFELFSILINKQNEENLNMNNKSKKFQFDKNNTLKYIISSLLEKIILFLTSDETPLDLTNCSNLLMVLLIQKVNELTTKLYNNYQYDIFGNISFFDYIKYYINDNQNELIKRQKDFNDNIIKKIHNGIESNIKEKKSDENQREEHSDKIEQLSDDITMLVHDIFSIYEIFRTNKIIEEVLIPTCQKILNIFENYYNSQLPGYNKSELSLKDLLFITNLLYNFLNICSNEFEHFLERINIFSESIKKKLSDSLINEFNPKVNELYKDFMELVLKRIQFTKILKLYNYESLQKGHNLEDINNIFDEENNLWFNVRAIFGKIKGNEKLYKYVETEVIKRLVSSLNKIVLNDIEKSNIEGKNLDILIDKTKFFIEDNFINDESELSEENKKDIQKLYSYLDNLFQNKKIK